MVNKKLLNGIKKKPISEENGGAESKGQGGYGEGEKRRRRRNGSVRILRSNHE